MKDLLTQSARAGRLASCAACWCRNCADWRAAAVSAAVKVCGKACGEHGDPCTLPQGHTEGCKPRRSVRFAGRFGWPLRARADRRLKRLYFPVPPPMGQKWIEHVP